MKYLARTMVVFAVTLGSLCNVSTAASTTENCNWIGPDAGLNHYYDGRIGSGGRVRVVITFDKCTVRGTWFDSVELTDQRINGTLQADRSVALKILDKNGDVVARVFGSFPSRDPRGTFSSDKPLGSEVIDGKLLRGTNSTSNSVDLRLQNIWNGDDAALDSSAGIKDRKMFDGAILAFWEAVKSQNIPIVLQSIHYPLSVNTDSGSQVIQSARDLSREYRQIFTPKRRLSILEHLPVHLTEGYWTGTVALADQVLFDAQGKVICLGPCENPKSW